MTRCPACQSGIDPQARVCPWCRQKIGFRRDRLIGVIIAFAIVGGLAFAANRHSETTDTIIAAKHACDAQTGQNCSVN